MIKPSIGSSASSWRILANSSDDFVPILHHQWWLCMTLQESDFMLAGKLR
ncbi:hypothetical protein Droror1_Dr00008102 [Drosera rotundifolia]